MFLENIGAGEQGAYFLNQPIITEYLKMLNGKGAKNLFDKGNIDAIKNLFSATQDALNNKKAEINLSELENNIQNYSNYKIGWHGKGGPSDLENAIQQKIFDEFLKYAKMAEYAFKFTQATNYDTTSFKNGSAFTRKTWNTDIARESNIISSVDDILDNTFIGKQKYILSKSMQSMGAIFKLEQDSLRAIIDNILKPYGENIYMSNDNFDKLANKVKADFLDYIIQTKTGINSRIKELLVTPGTSVATRLEQAKKDYPDIQLLKELKVISGNRPDGAKSIKLEANLKDAYDENLYTGMMREMRDYNDELEQLYKDLIGVAILQGTYQSAISIKNIIPIEDYSEKVKYVLDAIVADESLDAFSDGMFHLNNFKDDEIMPMAQPKFFQASEAPVAEQLDSFGNYYADIYQYYSSLFPSIEAFSIKSSERKILLLSEKWNYVDVQNDFIKVPRVVTDKKTGASIDMVTGQTITKLDYAIRKSKGDYSLNDVFGYAKVKLPDGTPLTTPDKQGNLQHVYKLVNLYGDGERASEFYESFKESVLENGTIKMNQVIPNEKIIEYYGGKIEAKDVSLQPTMQPTQPSTSVSEFDIADKLTPIQQNFADGQGGRQMQPQFKGKSTMDLIISGDRTRTTRAKTDIQRMVKDYNLSKISDLVGKVIRMTDKTGRQVYTKITKVAIFTQEYQDATWQEEGWEKSVTDKNVGDYPYAIEFEVVNKPTQPSNVIEPKGTINIYWGQSESSTSTRILSNLAPRKFNYESVDGVNREYGSVEHAYQSNKNGKFDKGTYDAYVAKGGYGVKIAPKLTEVGKRGNLQIMKDLVVESFIQNPDSEAAKKLLQYENFTHNTNELIDKAFLEGLKLAQRELLNAQPSTSVKPDGISQEEWNNLSQEEKNKINEC
jgi:hypothetical protein